MANNGKEPGMADALAALESLDVLVTTLTGVRAQLIASGFSENAAEELVVTLFKQSGEM